MVTHYSSNGSDVACGRNTPNVVSCANPEEVSCKSCLKSLGKTDAAPAPQKNTTPSLAEIRKQREQQAKAAATPAPVATGFCFKANWRERLAAQPNLCRLPRGVAGVQLHV